MPRIARNQMETTFFHNMTQGINQEYIFEESKCKKKYIELLKEKADDWRIKLIAYTIMDNHAHILLYTENVNNMSQFMKSINEKFAMYYNYINERIGIVFRNRYKSQPIVSNTQLLNCIRYIFNNPVRAKIVLSPEKYIYSNFKEFQTSYMSNNMLDEIYKNIHHSIDFPKVNNEKQTIKAEFLDTIEDTQIFVKELIENYEVQNDLSTSKNAKEMKKLVCYIKENTNVSHRFLADILHISKATITGYIKK